jgi:hypothetical protein
MPLPYAELTVKQQIKTDLLPKFSAACQYPLNTAQLT